MTTSEKMGNIIDHNSKNELILLLFKLHLLNSKVITKEIYVISNSDHPFLKLNPGDEVEWENDGLSGTAKVGLCKIYTLKSNNNNNNPYFTTVQEINLIPTAMMSVH